MLLKYINRQKKNFGIIISAVIILNFFSLANLQQKSFKSYDEAALTSASIYTVNITLIRAGHPENIQHFNQTTINFEKVTKENYKVKQVVLISKNDFSLLINFQVFLTSHFATNT